MSLCFCARPRVNLVSFFSLFSCSSSYENDIQIRTQFHVLTTLAENIRLPSQGRECACLCVSGTWEGAGGGGEGWGLRVKGTRGGEGYDGNRIIVPSLKHQNAALCANTKTSCLHFVSVFAVGKRCG